MTRDRKEIEAALLKKGFRQRDSDHHFFVYYTLGGLKSIVLTKTSHSHKEISDDLLAQMARQCKLTKPLFSKLIECPLGQPEYESLLKQQGAV